jgi:hypothetical protein
VLADLLADIEAQGYSPDGTGPDVVVSLELFFEGNDDLGSIGCNLIDHPGPADFYATLRAVRDRPDVSGMWVCISDVNEGEWPFSDHVYVVTTAPSDVVVAWAERLDAEEPDEGWWNDQPPRRPIDRPSGSRVITLWWD